MTLPAALRDPGIYWDNCRPLDVEVRPAPKPPRYHLVSNPVLGSRARTLAQVYKMEASRKL